MIDHLVRSAAGSLGNWKARRIAKGKPPSDEDIHKEAQGRWPLLTLKQHIAIVAATKERDDRMK